MKQATPLRVLIVDDEPLARRGIRARLAGDPDVDIVGEAGSGRAAVRAIRELQPDLVFLDVQMPGLDGFGVLAEIGAERMPLTIFVTAYEQHALRAFDAHALDYLLKPLEDERFATALERARRRVAEHRSSEFGRRLSALLAEAGAHAGADPASAPVESTAGGNGYLSRFVVRTSGRVLLVPAEEVDWIEATGDYVRLHAGSNAHLVRERISKLAERLDPTLFARIHRSTIVNVSRIREFQPYFNREYIVVLKNGTRLKLSRKYRDSLTALFGDDL
jgi:two-component system, LytTR family, response regulator